MKLPHAVLSVSCALVVVAMTVGCSGGEGLGLSPYTPPTEPLELVVLHTNDLWGETDPCG